jgi:hypothetical protein
MAQITDRDANSSWTVTGVEGEVSSPSNSEAHVTALTKDHPTGALASREPSPGVEAEACASACRKASPNTRRGRDRQRRHTLTTPR